ncbi:MAG: hypothetical protein QM820_19265 [Minicystis sp.]
MPLGTSIGVLWWSGGVAVDPEGKASPLPGFVSNESSIHQQSLASSPDRVLGLITQQLYSEPSRQWVVAQSLDGHIVEELDLGWLGAPSATWDGVDFLLTADGDRTFVISPDAKLQGPAEGLATTKSNQSAMASAGVGHSLRAAVEQSSVLGVERVIVQSLVRPCP